MTTIPAPISPPFVGEELVSDAPPTPQATDAALASDRERFGEHLSERVGLAGSVLIEHPAERRLLATLGPEDLRAFAHAHGLEVVRRVGGRVFEFTRRRPS